MRKSKNKMT